MNWENCKKSEELTINKDILIVYGTKKLCQNYDLLSILTKEELFNADRIKNIDQRNTWLACRATLRLVLAKYLSLLPQSIILEKGYFGKLYVDGSNIFFNISHTNKSFILAFSTLGRVGIDIEKLNGNEDIPSLLQYAFSENEVSYCKNANLNQRFAEVWTLKEAFLKAVGVGLLSKLTLISVKGASENKITQLKLNQKTFLCPYGETASIVYRANQILKLISLP